MDIEKILETPLAKAVIAILIPAVVTIIISPYTNLFGLKGVIYKDPEFLNDSTIIIPVVSTIEIEDLLIQINIIDTSLYKIQKSRLVYLDGTTHDNGLVKSQIEIRPRTPYLEKIQIPKIQVDEYVLRIPITPHFKDETLIGGNTEVTFGVLKDDSFKYVKTKKYKWYLWRYFHPFFASLIVLLISILVLYYSVLKNKRK